MSAARQAPEDRLASVERLRELELEYARQAHAATELALARQRELAVTVRKRLDETNALAQTQMQAGIPVQELQHLRAYARWQARGLANQEQRVREAEAAAGEARKVVARRFQELTAIERLRGRRAAEAALEAARAAQKRLDEHAMLRLAMPKTPRQAPFAEEKQDQGRQ